MKIKSINMAGAVLALILAVCVTTVGVFALITKSAGLTFNIKYDQTVSAIVKVAPSITTTVNEIDYFDADGDDADEGDSYFTIFDNVSASKITTSQTWNTSITINEEGIDFFVKITNYSSENLYVTDLRFTATDYNYEVFALSLIDLNEAINYDTTVFYRVHLAYIGNEILTSDTSIVMSLNLKDTRIPN